MPASESQRHKWVKLREHTYICRVCGCGRVNAQKSGGWETTFHLPDGTSRVLSKRPACAVGPHTDEYLGKYWPAIELLTEHTERIAKALDQEDPHPEDMPTAVCPRCGAEQNDFDGFGMVYCTACKFCTHPSRDGGVCGICGDDEKTEALAAVGEAVREHVDNVNALSDAYKQGGGSAAFRALMADDDDPDGLPLAGD